MKDRATRLEKIYKTIKVELIESTVKNMVIPDEKNINIIDGRQRYETLLRFYNNEFDLKESGLQKLKDWEGCKYKELAPNLRTLFG